MSLEIGLDGRPAAERGLEGVDRVDGFVRRGANPLDGLVRVDVLLPQIRSGPDRFVVEDPVAHVLDRSEAVGEPIVLTRFTPGSYKRLL